MIKKDKHIRGGILKTQIRVVESYRPRGNSPPKQRTIKSFGYLEDQSDPEAFMAEVENFNANFKKQNAPLRIETDCTEQMYSTENRKLNYGYKFLVAVYEFLNIDKFIENYISKEEFKGEYSLAEIFKFLVIQRILNPDSKRATFQLKNGFYGMETDFDLQDVYRSLKSFSEFEVELQRHLNEIVKNKIGRDLSHAFYDVTNYFFEIDFPDGEDDLRKKGVSKEHRTDPITAMGLFIDDKGLPVNMSIFPGNTSDSVTLEPTMKDIKTSYDLGRLVVVADKGLNTSKNIDFILNSGDGYVFSQILKGTKGKRYHDKLFNENDWIFNNDKTYKYKIFEEDYKSKDKNGKTIILTRKVLIYWDKFNAEATRMKRQEKLEKAEKSVKNNAYSIKKGIEEYTTEHVIDKETGEVLENVKKIRSINEEKAMQDALYDGYFCIITSELDYDERKIRKVYGSLWKIEQSFRIMKSDLYARPVFVSKNEHIRAHFLICFVALLIIRIIQYKMDKNALSAERIARALNAANCRILKGGIVHLDDVGGTLAFTKRQNKKGELVDTLKYSSDDEIALDYKLIQNLFNTNFYQIYNRIENFNQFLRKISL